MWLWSANSGSCSGLKKSTAVLDLQIMEVREIKNIQESWGVRSTSASVSELSKPLKRIQRVFWMERGLKNSWDWTFKDHRPVTFSNRGIYILWKGSSSNFYLSVLGKDKTLQKSGYQLGTKCDSADIWIEGSMKLGRLNVGDENMQVEICWNCSTNFQESCRDPLNSITSMPSMWGNPCLSRRGLV